MICFAMMNEAMRIENFETHTNRVVHVPMKNRLIPRPKYAIHLDYRIRVN